MSGHSKWSTIKRKKGANDAARAKVFTKFAREMAVAIKEGGADINGNSKLKEIVAKAKANNVPNDNINRIIQKYKSGNVTENYESVTYEGYGPSGIAVIVETLTDNRNRTAGEVRHAFDKYGSGMGQSGCVSWQFDRKGVIIIERDEDMDEDTVMMEAIDAGAADFVAEEEAFEIYTDVDTFPEVRDALEAKGYTFAQAELSLVPQNYIEMNDEEGVKNMTKLLDMLDDNDDVQNVYHNWEEVE
ncbi:MAG: YebC/PmpR family DNA-binding transcriptional regulator [Clostridia bacterium]|nr:YebC/PmpR family DNA-binding transcriptional regulator [Oscillospiraceae bacterium]MBQ2911036.1 YebC/PmpR family DNA-binding transcriptional regulator [Clostridia bacterium]MBQ6836656.1 YebC/PmpR family DNA-binding transcriptional regulator [Clostridia bacterium]MBQ6868256.1 YebC/PmpR family DNA-binding transcriptional regulator [Clostridia bacterium]MBQ6933658.1 YebC/PmpR family DNA-binding transcriptional regulator [Clostridia bacterium]